MPAEADAQFTVWTNQKSVYALENGQADSVTFKYVPKGLNEYVEPEPLRITYQYVGSPNADSVLNKCYATLGLAGNTGPDGDCDIEELNGGITGYVRQLINSQCLPTDEMICCWGDEGIPQFNYNKWDESHPMLLGFYYRLYFSIYVCNLFLDSYATDATMAAEARFLRALLYFYLMDGWGGVPLVTTISSETPKQATRQEIFNFVESELLACESNLSEAKAKKSTDANYGRVDKAAAWLLLARLYLNAEIYTGADRCADAQTYAQKVIDSDYKLNTTAIGDFSAYQTLFMGDNGETDAAYEFILPVYQDGVKAASYGTSFFAMASFFSGDMYVTKSKYGNGTVNTWSGNRCRPDLILKFFPGYDAPEESDAQAMIAKANDDRALFWSKDRTLNIEANDDFNKGYATIKVNNFYATGGSPHDSKFPDTDWPLMRKAEAYLILAEASARLNGGYATADGLKAINTLRTRAHASTLTSASLDDICDEWSREFYFEGYRRTTLIRFGRFGGGTSYTWQWKGGTYAGSYFGSAYNLFPFSAAELDANPNIKQNPGFVPVEPDPQFTLWKDGVSVYSLEYARADSVSFEYFPVGSDKSAIPEMWYIIGACVGDGAWNNTPEGLGISSFPMSVIADAAYDFNTGKETLKFTGYFTTAGFKVIRQLGDWTYQLGMNDGAFIFNDGGSGNINVAADGYYVLTVDNANNAASIEAYDGEPTVYSGICLSGDFNEWTETPMTAFSTTKDMAGHNHLWVYTLDVPDGGTSLKFKIAGSWETNWGGKSFPYGIGVGNGDNITLTAGTWTICFNDIDGSYAFLKHE